MADKPRILITRPEADAKRTARALKDIGAVPVIESVLKVRFLSDASLDLEDAQAVLATSANGVRALAKGTKKRDIPLIAVGDQTAEEARTQGFKDVASASGTVETLADYIKTHVDKDKGALVHVAPTHLAGDLGKQLEKAGYAYRKAVAYQVDRAEKLSPGCVRAITAGRIDGVLFYSPRTAKLVLDLFDKAGITGNLAEIHAFCLSAPVAKVVNQYTWKGVHTAAKPNQDALMVEVEVALSNNARKKTSKASKTSKAAAKETGKKTSGAADTASSSPSGVKKSTGSQKDKAASGGAARTIIPAVIAMIVITATVIASAPWWYPWVTGSATGGPGPQGGRSADSPALGALESRIDTLTERLKTVEDRPAPAPTQNGAGPSPDAGRAEELAGKLEGLAGRLDTVSKRLDQIGESVQQLEKNMGAQAEVIENVRSGQKAAVERVLGETQRLNQDVGALTARLKSVEEAQAAQSKLAGGAAAFLLAVGQLKEALNTSQAYAAELAAVNAVKSPDLVAENTPAARALDTLQARAETGVPTTAALRARYAALEAEAIKVTVADDQGNWWERMLGRVSGDMTVRRAEDNLEGNSVPAITARARVAVKDADLAGAVQTLQALSGPAARVMEPWIADARARIEADRAVRALNARALAVMAGTTRQAAAPERQTNNSNNSTNSGGGTAPKPEDQ